MRHARISQKLECFGCGVDGCFLALLFEVIVGCCLGAFGLLGSCGYACNAEQHLHSSVRLIG